MVVPVACPQGFYCPPGTVMGTEFPCPQGTVQPQIGASTEGDCLPCPSGYMSTTSILVAHVICILEISV